MFIPTEKDIQRANSGMSDAQRNAMINKIKDPQKLFQRGIAFKEKSWTDYHISFIRRAKELEVPQDIIDAFNNQCKDIESKALRQAELKDNKTIEEMKKQLNPNHVQSLSSVDGVYIMNIDKQGRPTKTATRKVRGYVQMGCNGFNQGDDFCVVLYFGKKYMNAYGNWTNERHISLGNLGPSYYRAERARKSIALIQKYNITKYEPNKGTPTF